MKTQRTRGRLILAACAVSALTAASAFAQLAPNQTNGFGNNKLVTFTYLQNFDCVDQPKLDLDFNGIEAESDPHEMQTPICQPVTEPTQDPTGASIAKTAHLYVLIPMFSVDNDQDPDDAMRCPNGGRHGELCGARLGAELVKLFGAVPEAWKKKVNSAITTQCPDPRHPVPENLHDACFFRRSIEDTRSPREDPRPSRRTCICANAQSQPCRRHGLSQHQTNLVGS